MVATLPEMIASSADAPKAAEPRTLGAELERDRLEHRVGRATVAIAVLHRIAGEHRRDLGATPRHLRQAIADFEAQVEGMNARLRDLAREPASVHSRSSRFAS
jgi:hypothetical protein